MNTNNRMKLPKQIYLPEETEMTSEVLKKLIEQHEINKIRYKTLQKYYEGWADILEKPKKDEYKADNRMVLPYPSYIVNTLLGLLLGRPVSYKTAIEDNNDSWNNIQAILNYNDEQDKNTSLAKTMGIKGRSYEVMYTNENSHTRIAEIQPENMIYIYDTAIEPQPLFAIYIRENLTLDDENSLAATIYTRDNIQEWIQTENGFSKTEEYEHHFKEVPVIEYMNNDEGIGDFERVLSLIDAMNLVQSDTANDFEEFTDALLVLYGMLNIDNKDVTQILEDRILVLDDVDGPQGASWLIKDINDTALENYKNRVDADIHKFSAVPNMSDEKFAGNVSGVSMKYKLLATDQVISIKQKGFKRALLRRLKLIMNIENIKEDSDLKYKDIDVIFKDNKPINEKENIEAFEKLKGQISDKTALSRLYFIEDVDAEMESIEEEKNEYEQEFLKEIDKEDDTDE